MSASNDLDAFDCFWSTVLFRMIKNDSLICRQSSQNFENERKRKIIIWSKLTNGLWICQKYWSIVKVKMLKNYIEDFFLLHFLHFFKTLDDLDGWKLNLMYSVMFLTGHMKFFRVWKFFQYWTGHLIKLSKCHCSHIRQSFDMN